MLLTHVYHASFAYSIAYSSATSTYSNDDIVFRNIAYLYLHIRKFQFWIYVLKLYSYDILKRTSEYKDFRQIEHDGKDSTAILVSCIKIMHIYFIIKVH